MRRALFDGQHLDVARSEFALGWTLQFSKGKRDRESEDLMRAALRTRVAQLGPSHRDVGLARLGLALAAIKSDKPLPAFQEIAAALPTFESGGGDKRAANALSAYLRGIAAQRRNQPLEAANHFEQAVNQIAALFGGEHPVTNYMKCELADAQLAGRDDQAAERVYREALDSNRKLLGRRPFVAHSIESFAWFLSDRGRYDEADTLLGEAIEIQADALGNESGLAGQLWFARARISAGRNDLREASSRLHLVLKIHGKNDAAVYGGALRDSAFWLSWLALDSEDFPLYRETCRILVDSRQYSDAFPDRATALQQVAWMCALVPGALEDPLVAVRVAQEAVAADRNNSRCERALGAALYRTGRMDESIEHLDSACRLDGQGNDIATRTLLAMAHHMAAHADKAKSELNDVQRFVADKFPELLEIHPNSVVAGDLPGPSSAITPVVAEKLEVLRSVAWQDRIALKYLFLEARSLIGEAGQ